MKSYRYIYLTFALTAMVTGCAMHSRLDPSPTNPQFFRSTRRYAPTAVINRTEIDPNLPINEGTLLLGTGWLLGLIASVPLVIATDVVLAPLDAYGVWQEHQTTEEFLKQHQGNAIQPESEGEAWLTYPITTAAAGWKFKIQEDRNGRNVVKGRDPYGRTFQREGMNPDELLKQCTAEAIEINKEIRSAVNRSIAEMPADPNRRRPYSPTLKQGEEKP